MNRQKQHNNRGQSNSLPIMCILPLQHGRFMYFGLMGFHNQLCPFHTLINVLVTNLFYIHAQRRIVKAARRDKIGVLQSVPWSLGHPLSDVTSASCGSPNQPIRRNKKHWSVFLNILLQAKNCDASQCWRTVFGLATKVKLCEGFAKSY